MWDKNLIVLKDWSQFSKELQRALISIHHNGLIAVRNFALVSYDPEGNMLDQLDTVKNTGTDRNNKSIMWNAEGHDFEHDITPSGKKPSEITYAYVAETSNKGYLVHYHHEKPVEFDLTKGLTEHDGILIYDASKLKRVSKNEHWFLTDPKEALLLIFTIKFDE